MRGTERGCAAPQALEPTVPRGPQTLRGGPDRAQEGHEGSLPETGWAHPQGRAEESQHRTPNADSSPASGQSSLGSREMDRVFLPASEPSPGVLRVPSFCVYLCPKLFLQGHQSY